MQSNTRRFTAHTIITYILALILGASIPLYASNDASPKEDSADSSFWKTLAGQPVDHQLYAGMWTYHTHASSREKDNATNYALSYVKKGYFVGVFKNSYYNWSFGAGLQRDVYDKHFASDTQQFKVGYRAGLMTGYDDRLCSYCGDSPVLPFIVPYIDWQYKNFGLESQYAVILATIGFYYHFN